MLVVAVSVRCCIVIDVCCHIHTRSSHSCGCSAEVHGPCLTHIPIPSHPRARSHSQCICILPASTFFRCLGAGDLHGHLRGQCQRIQHRNRRLAAKPARPATNNNNSKAQRVEKPKAKAKGKPTHAKVNRPGADVPVHNKVPVPGVETRCKTLG